MVRLVFRPYAMYDERFARQYRYEPPSEFPLSLPCTIRVHHLSGPNRCANSNLSNDWSVAGANIPAVTFITQAGLTTHELAHMLDSLVRVSRRVEKNHLVIKPCTTEGSQKHSHTRGHATMFLEVSPHVHGR